MEAAIAVQVLHQAVAFLIKLPAVGQILLCALGKIILIHKVISSVVRRVDIDHLHLAQIGFLQQLEHFQVVPFDVEVLGIKAAGSAVPPHALLPAGTQGFGNGGIGQQH